MDEDDSAMQQMMGFSAFSSGDKKRPNKKQKLNSDRNASSTHIHASAGNATPLGIRSTSQTTVSRQGTHPANLPFEPQMEVKPQDHSMSDPPPIATTDDVSNNHENDPLNYTDPSDSAPTATTITAVVPDPTSTIQHRPSSKATIYTSSDIRSDPNYWNSTSTTSTGKPQPGSGRPSNNASNGTATNNNNSHRHPHTRNRDTYPDNDEIGYTNSQSGYTLTNRELNEYARGKDEVQEDGSTVKVYFKPNFLEDPWAEFS